MKTPEQRIDELLTEERRTRAAAQAMRRTAGAMRTRAAGLWREAQTGDPRAIADARDGDRMTIYAEDREKKAEAAVIARCNALAFYKALSILETVS